jgi:type 1 glutamine amidotransferase
MIHFTIITRVFFLNFLLGFAALSLPAQETKPSDQNQELPSLADKKILVVYGGWEGHSPKAFAERIEKWAKGEGADVVVSNSLDSYTDSALMASLDLIIQYRTMDKISRAQENALLTAVKGGMGFAGCHGGIGDSFRQNTNYQYMVGGQWVAHPGGEIDYRVNILDTGDPVTEGVEDFDIHTEQYYMHVDPNVKVLATTTFTGDHDSWIDGAVMPVAWKKYFGKGRIFYLSIGHSPDTFDVPEVWTMLSRGIRWASGSKHQAWESWLQPAYR